MNCTSQGLHADYDFITALQTLFSDVMWHLLLPDKTKWFNSTIQTHTTHTNTHIHTLASKFMTFGWWLIWLIGNTLHIQKRLHCHCIPVFECFLSPWNQKPSEIINCCISPYIVLFTWKRDCYLNKTNLDKGWWWQFDSSILKAYYFIHCDFSYVP